MTARRTPDWLVERLHAGDLPPAEAARVRAALEAEPGGLARLEALAQDDRAFLEAHPPGPAVGRIRRAARPPERPDRSRRRFLVLAPALAGAAAAALLVANLGEDTRLKGDPQLVVQRQGPSGQAEPLRDGAPARAGDLVQLAYAARGASHGAVLSVDGRGVVTLHLPEEPGPAAALEERGTVALPHAYLLDDAPAFERFFLVTSDAPFDAAVAVEAARALAARGDARSGALALPDGLAARSFLLVKVPR